MGLLGLVEMLQEWQGGFGIDYGDGLFVAVAIDGTGNRVMTSPDGITWTTRTTPTTPSENNWRAVIYTPTIFVAVGDFTTQTMMSGTLGLPYPYGVSIPILDKTK